MIKIEDISGIIDDIWVPRHYFEMDWEQHINSCLPIFVTGPASSGKYSYLGRKCLQDNQIWDAVSTKSVNIKEMKSAARKDPSSTAGVFIYFPYFKNIQSRTMFFYSLQEKILIQFSYLLFENPKLLREFEKKTGLLTESALDFFTVLNDLLVDEFGYKGRINIYLCGLQYIYPEILRFFLEYLRAFVDSISGRPELERFKLVLSSLRDGLHLTEKYGDTCSPLNSANRIYMKDFNESEFHQFLLKFKEESMLKIEDEQYLYSLTKGDIYFTKVILTYCESNIFASKEDIQKKNKFIKNTLVDKAVDNILINPTLECVPPFHSLKNFIEQYDEVRDVLYTLNAGADIAPMTDTSGVYTIPESSGAVVKIEKDNKYGYKFRNEIYRRFVENYIKSEDKKVESIISDTIGRGDLSFPATLASAIRHEMAGPIGVITSELNHLFNAPNISAKEKECLELIKEANINLYTIYSFLEDLWSTKPILNQVEFNQYIKENVEVFKPHLSHRRVEVKFDFDKRIKDLKVDTSALRIALINLIINARDAILLKGSGIITIKTEMGKRGIRLEVKDDGIGMDKFTLQNVVNYGFSTKGEGRGIGLTLCKTVVRRMNAELTISSKVKKGTTITIKFQESEGEK